MREAMEQSDVAMFARCDPYESHGDDKDMASYEEGVASMTKKAMKAMVMKYGIHDKVQAKLAHLFVERLQGRAPCQRLRFQVASHTGERC